MRGVLGRASGVAVAALVVAIASAGGAGGGIIGPGGEFVHALALQPDGKVVVAGSVAESRVLVARFDADGRLDASFGSGGRVVTAEPPDRAVAVAVAAGGRIVVATFGHVLGYLPDGSLDGGFGDRGVVSVGPSGLAAVALQPDGKIVVAGRSSASPSGFFLARLLPDGGLDPTFGSGGVVTTSFEHTADARALVLEPDGRIVAGGTISLPLGGSRLALARYLPDGRLDPDFGSGGVVTASACGDDFELNALTASPGGRITAVGTALARFLPDGSLDPAFAGGRPVPLGFRALAAAPTADGGVVAAGQGVLLRFRADGSLDSSFGVDGAVSLRFPGEDAAVDQAGRIVVAGSTGYALSSIGLQRFLPNGGRDATFEIGNVGLTADELRTVSTRTGRLRTLLRAERLFSATLSPDRRWLAFVRSVGGRYELDLIGVGGSGLRRLLVNRFRDHELTDSTTLSWSRDSRRVAFDAWTRRFPASCGSSAPRPAAYTIDIRTRRVLLVALGATTPRWSPDGRRIAYADADTQKIYVAAPDGSGRHAVASGHSLAWSPDARRLAFVEAQHQWIDVVGRDGRARHRLVPGFQPTWSPNGKQIAYWRGCSTSRVYACLRVVTVADGRSRQVARYHELSGPASWSADGTRLALPAIPRPPEHPADPTAAELRTPIAVVTVRTGKTRLYRVGNAPAVPLAPVQWGAGAQTLAFVFDGIPAATGIGSRSGAGTPASVVAPMGLAWPMGDN